MEGGVGWTGRGKGHSMVPANGRPTRAEPHTPLGRESEAATASWGCQRPVMGLTKLQGCLLGAGGLPGLMEL